MDELIARVARNLAKEEPPSRGLRLASVAIIVQGGDAPRVLLIRRADRTGDPWSGQIAFPGGKTSPEDKTAKDTAAREAMEEVGIDLGKSAEFLGYGRVTTTHMGTMDVVPCVFMLKGEVEARPNVEVASYRWVGLQDFLTPAAQSVYRLDLQGKEQEMPAYLVGDYLVWGLTHRIIGTIINGT